MFIQLNSLIKTFLSFIIIFVNFFPNRSVKYSFVKDAVFNNLIDNAIKYSEKNTKINILVKTNENNIDVIIKDQGIGIPREHIPKITERFFRVNPEKSKEVGGTGLGLAIVKHIVNQHRGEMDISSEEGKGTQISLNFPKN